MTRKQVALVRSTNRFERFRNVLQSMGAEVTVIDFSEPSWRTEDYARFDVLIHFPSFQFSSNHPLALHWVYDNLMHIHSVNPRLKIFPDPKVIPFYSDKYRQFLFLAQNGFRIPKTYSLESAADVSRVIGELGFPFVVKNRFGAGGDYVRFIYKASTAYRLLEYSNLRFGIRGGLLDLLRQGTRKYFLRGFKGRNSAEYPFWSPPLLAQKFISHDHDLKVVIGDGEPVEAHWRRQATPEMLKMNIDGGGYGEWSHVPQEALDVCVRLANSLGAKWLNVDLLPVGSEFLVSEFSPVWHHYSFKEKDTFVYKDDYNLKKPIERYCDLETILSESYLRD